MYKQHKKCAKTCDNRNIIECTKTPQVIASLLVFHHVHWKWKLSSLSKCTNLLETLLFTSNNMINETEKGV